MVGVGCEAEVVQAEGVAGGAAVDGPRYIVDGEEQEPPVAGCTVSPGFLT